MIRVLLGRMGLRRGPRVARGAQRPRPGQERSARQGPNAASPKPASGRRPHRHLARDSEDQRIDREGVGVRRDQEGRSRRPTISEFIRRVFIDLIGRIATPEEVDRLRTRQVRRQAREARAAAPRRRPNTSSKNKNGQAIADPRRRRTAQGPQAHREVLHRRVRRALGQHLDRVADDPHRPPGLPRPDARLARRPVLVTPSRPSRTRIW